MHTSRKIKIDLVAVPFSGHLYPLLELVVPLLQNPNFDIRLFTGINKVDIAEKVGFTVIPLFPDQPNKMEDIANTSKQTTIIEMYQQLKQNVAIISEVTDLLLESFQENETDIVIADFVAVPAGIACDQLGIPWITTIPTPFAIESKTTTPSYLGGWKPSDTFIGKIRDHLGRKLIRSFKKFCIWLLRKQLPPNFELYNLKGEESIYSPYAILGLGMKELEFRKDFPAQFLWAGPCCQSLEADNLALPQGKPKVLVTIGTHLLWGKKELLSFVTELSLAHPTYDFLVSLGDNQSKESCSNLRPNVFVYPYLPYSQVLEQVSYVIHHGGAGIFYNCIKYQLPALILPHDYDQFDYATRGELAQIALTADYRKVKQIKQAFSEMLQRKDWNELATLSKQFREYQPTHTLEQEIEQILKERGKI